MILNTDHYARWITTLENGAGFAEDTLKLLPGFIAGACELETVLREAFTESDLPIPVDVFDCARIPESFREEIRRGQTVEVRGKNKKGGKGGRSGSSDGPLFCARGYTYG